MKLTDNTGYFIQHIAFSLGRQSDQVLQEQLGIGYSQFKIMLVLQDNPNVQQKHIAHVLGQTEASISRQVKLMLDQGLLQTAKNPHNRREHLTSLTAKGVRFIDESLRILSKYQDPMFVHLSDKQRRQLVDLLTLIHQETCKGNRPGRCFQTYLD